MYREQSIDRFPKIYESERGIVEKSIYRDVEYFKVGKKTANKTATPTFNQVYGIFYPRFAILLPQPLPEIYGNVSVPKNLFIS